MDDVEHVGAVYHRVGRVIFLMETVIDRQFGDGFASDGIPHLQTRREHRPFVHVLGQAEVLEHAEHVGAELDAGADFLELRRLLDDVNRNALAGQGQRRAQSADAAADHKHRRAVFIGAHRHSPGFHARATVGSSSRGHQGASRPR